jgi:hypothetical protein
VSYGVGIELAADAVRLAAAGRDLPAGPVEIVVPVLHVEGERLLVGGDALTRGTARPQGLVTDVVGQFTADRVALAGGRMLDMDDALRELLGGVVRRTAEAHGGPPGAVTVSCPPGWDAAALGRVRAVGADLDLADLRVVGGRDVLAAPQGAADAASRLPVPVAPARGTDPSLPATEWGARPPRPERAADPVSVIPSAPAGGRGRTVTVFLAVVGALVLAVAALALRPRSDPMPPPASFPTFPSTAR